MREAVGRASNSKKHSTLNYKVMHDTCEDIPAIPLSFRQNALNGPTGQAAHQQLSAQVEALWSIELREPAKPAKPKDALKVAFWNLERCKFVEASAAHLAAVDADVNLLCELDSGMARSSQRHTARDIADIIKQGYAFAVEYVELNLGDEGERIGHAGEQNSHGLHGNAVLARDHLANPALIRLDADGQWFHEQQVERRLGGRIAIAATIQIAGIDVAIICTHFESRGNPDTRAMEMCKLLAAVEEYALDKPVILAGDFNTNTASRDLITDEHARAELLREDSRRFTEPATYEPLFDEAVAAGFDWLTANRPGATQRAHSEPGFERKLDWFFTRGLRAWGASIVSAADADGCVLSDHDMITVMVAPEEHS